MKILLPAALLAASLWAQDITGPLGQAQTAIAAATTAAEALTAELATAKAATHPTGTVRYFQMANTNWDPFTSTSDPVLQAMIAGDVERIATYSPYFDAKLAWMPRADVYVDSYAIYVGDPIVVLHPDWVLHDSIGRKLFIPFGCANGSCPQFAADISNPAFVAWRIAGVAGAIAPGYPGLLFDDVNLALSVSNGAGMPVVPIDRLTGKAMTLTAWQTYFAAFLGKVRAAFPSIEIVHNSVWFTGTPAANPLIAAQMAQADLIYVERGFGDAGITGGTGQFSLAALMNYVDSVHAIGKAVVIADYHMDFQLYSLACYYLVQNGRDFWGIGDQLPTNWPPNLYRTDLGIAKGPRYQTAGLWRRDFANGFVIVNEPGAVSQTVTLDPGATDPDGNAIAAVTLAAKQGGIYLNAAR